MASSVIVDEGQATPLTRADPRPVAPRKRRVRERVSLGHLFMIAAALSTFVIVVSLLQDRTITNEILVAEVEILPGTDITVDMVTVIDIPAGSDLVGSVATMADLAGGEVSAGHRLAPGDPITLTVLAPASTPSGLRAMSLPIDRVDAAGGDLAPGDRIDVVSVEGNAAAFVAVDLEVIDTQGAEQGSGALSTSSLSSYYVTVSIDAATALKVALAMESGRVSILRSTGAEPVADAERQLNPTPAPPPPADIVSTDG